MLPGIPSPRAPSIPTVRFSKELHVVQYRQISACLNASIVSIHDQEWGRRIAAPCFKQQSAEGVFMNNQNSIGRAFFIPILLIAVVLAGCNNKKSNTTTTDASSKPPTVQQGVALSSLVGSVTFGPVKNGSIALYEVNDADGSTGAFLGSVMTKADGSFKINRSKPIPSKSVRFKLSMGSFKDEATGNNVTINSDIYADFNVAGITGELQFTPLTSLVNSLAKHLLDSGKAATMSDAINMAARLIGAKFGVSDIVGTKPVLTTNDPSGDTHPGVRYGLILGGLSHVAKDMAVDPVNLQHALNNDISDGSLNGKTGGLDTEVIGGTTLPPDAAGVKLISGVKEFMEDLKTGSSTSIASGSAADIIVSSISPSIPADPGTPPPGAAAGTLKPSFDVTPTIDEGRMALTLRGLIDPATGLAIDYTAPNKVVVVDNGVVKGIKITSLSKTASSNADIVFLVDTTGSMGGTIDGVKQSMMAFVNNLKSNSLDVRVGVVAFADELDPAANPAGISAADPAAYTVAGFTELSSDLTETGSVVTFINSLSACYMGACGGDAPEGALDSLSWAHDNLKFRPGSQKIFIMFTDVTSWGKDAAPTSTTEVSPASPWTDATLAAALAADSSVVHVVSNDTPPWEIGEYNVKYLAMAGGTNSSPGTGGTWTVLGGGMVDLTSLPITAAVTGSVLIEYNKTGTGIGNHDVRVVVYGSATDGEATKTVSY